MAQISVADTVDCNNVILLDTAVDFNKRLVKAQHFLVNDAFVLMSMESSKEIRGNADL